MNNPADNRPNPDELLASIKKEEETGRRGKLKIFFGMCAGVGKTYSMLKMALLDKEKGTDIVLGYVETHNRKELLGLVDSLEIVPRQLIKYKGTEVGEMDLDAVIRRKPGIVLVDELAHTNVPGSRHLKRFQDVLEILDNGINVYTTLNVQHLESRSGIVTQITGVPIRETLSDEIFENADDIELVDITPDELLERLGEGKIYSPEMSKEAALHFFRKGNITALREMALRIVADRVDRQLKTYMQENRIPGPWKSGMHLLALIGPGPGSAGLIRWAKNLSYTTGASFAALNVESSSPLNNDQRTQLNKNIRLARQLGAEIFTSSGDDIVKTILNVARRENISHIVIGKPGKRSILNLLTAGDFIKKLIKESGNIDIYIIGSETGESGNYHKPALPKPVFTSGISRYLLTAAIVILSSAVCFHFADYLGYQTVSFILLFVVSILATFMGIGPILLGSSLGAFIWNFFFIPPRFTLHIDKTEDMLMLGMFFTIALVNGVLTSRVRRQERITRDREERTSALYQLTRALEGAESMDELVNIAGVNIKKHFGFDSVFFIQGSSNHLYISHGINSYINLTDTEVSVAEWVYRHSRKAGRFTDTLPSNRLTFFPLSGSTFKPGVLAVELHSAFHEEKDQFWETFLSQISNSLERKLLNELARKAKFLDESDRLYKTLFNSISHELRIPVAAIMSASDSLLLPEHSEEIRNELSFEIFKASKRLNRLIENLLNMSRLESGRITPRFDWYDIHDLFNKVCENLQEELKPFRLHIVVPENMPLVKIDFGLLEEALYNLVHNAAQYSRPSTSIRIKAFYDNGTLNIQVMDRGPGFPQNEISLIFNKFYRVEGSKTGGTGLGLSIAKGFVEAHKGTIIAENRQNGGSRFIIKIPTENISEEIREF